jgi:hypothetical protein
MEEAFGEDFSSVRMVVGRQAELSRIHARAAAMPEQIVFASRSPDRRTVAHELAHVIQYRLAHGRAPSVADHAEREAERAAEHVATGGSFRVRVAEVAPVMCTTAEPSTATVEEVSDASPLAEAARSQNETFYYYLLLDQAKPFGPINPTDHSLVYAEQTFKFQQWARDKGYDHSTIGERIVPDGVLGPQTFLVMYGLVAEAEAGANLGELRDLGVVLEDGAATQVSAQVAVAILNPAEQRTLWPFEVSADTALAVLWKQRGLTPLDVMNIEEWIGASAAAGLTPTDKLRIMERILERRSLQGIAAIVALPGRRTNLHDLLPIVRSYFPEDQDWYQYLAYKADTEEEVDELLASLNIDPSTMVEPDLKSYRPQFRQQDVGVAVARRIGLVVAVQLPSIDPAVVEAEVKTFTDQSRGYGPLVESRAVTDEDVAELHDALSSLSGWRGYSRLTSRQLAQRVLDVLRRFPEKAAVATLRRRYEDNYHAHLPSDLEAALSPIDLATAREYLRENLTLDEFIDLTLSDRFYRADDEAAALDRLQRVTREEVTRLQEDDAYRDRVLMLLWEGMGKAEYARALRLLAETAPALESGNSLATLSTILDRGETTSSSNQPNKLRLEYARYRIELSVGWFGRSSHAYTAIAILTDSERAELLKMTESPGDQLLGRFDSADQGRLRQMLDPARDQSDVLRMAVRYGIDQSSGLDEEGLIAVSRAVAEYRNAHPDFQSGSPTTWAVIAKLISDPEKLRHYLRDLAAPENVAHQLAEEASGHPIGQAHQNVIEFIRRTPPSARARAEAGMQALSRPDIPMTTSGRALYAAYLEEGRLVTARHRLEESGQLTGPVQRELEQQLAAVRLVTLSYEVIEAFKPRDFLTVVLLLENATPEQRQTLHVPGTELMQGISGVGEMRLAPSVADHIVSARFGVDYGLRQNALVWKQLVQPVNRRATSEELFLLASDSSDPIGMVQEAVRRMDTYRRERLRNAFVAQWQVQKSLKPGLTRSQDVGLADLTNLIDTLELTHVQRESFYDALFGQPVLVQPEPHQAGIPTGNPNQEAAYMAARLAAAYESRSGELLDITSAVSFKGTAYDAAAIEFFRRYDQLHPGGFTPEEVALLAEIYYRATHAGEAYYQIRASVSEVASTVAASLAASAVVATFGPLGLTGVGLMGSIAGGSAALAVDAVIRGEVDAQFQRAFSQGALEGLLAGVGGALSSKIIALVRGPSSALQMGKFGAHHALTEIRQEALWGAVEGAIDGVIGGAGSEVIMTVADISVWEKSYNEIMAQFLAAGARGVLLGGGGGVIGGALFSGIVEGGSQISTAARSRAAAQRLAGWRAYQRADPNTSWEEFRATNLPSTGGDVVADLREELAGYIHDFDAELAGVRIQVLSDADFLTKSGSETAQAAVVIVREGGRLEPVVVVRETAAIGALREEAVHLEQWYRGGSTRARMEQLLEHQMADWENTSLSEKISLYRDKVAVELEAADMLVERLQAALDTEVLSGNRDDLMNDLRSATANRHNLHQRDAYLLELESRLHLDNLPAEELPEFLDEPPRLFTKSDTSVRQAQERSAPAPVPAERGSASAVREDEVAAKTSKIDVNRRTIFTGYAMLHGAFNIVRRGGRVIVHDAGMWKKDLLTTHGVAIVQAAKAEFGEVIDELRISHLHMDHTNLLRLLATNFVIRRVVINNHQAEVKGFLNVLTDLRDGLADRAALVGDDVADPEVEIHYPHGVDVTSTVMRLAQTAVVPIDAGVVRQAADAANLAVPRVRRGPSLTSAITGLRTPARSEPYPRITGTIIPGDRPGTLGGVETVPVDPPNPVFLAPSYRQFGPMYGRRVPRQRREPDIDRQASFYIEELPEARFWFGPDARVVPSYSELMVENEALIGRLTASAPPLTVYMMGHHFGSGFFGTENAEEVLAFLDRMIRFSLAPTAGTDAMGGPAMGAHVISASIDLDDPHLRQTAPYLFLASGFDIAPSQGVEGDTFTHLTVVTEMVEGQAVPRLSGRQWEGLRPDRTPLRDSFLTANYLEQRIASIGPYEPLMLSALEAMLMELEAQRLAYVKNAMSLLHDLEYGGAAPGGLANSGVELMNLVEKIRTALGEPAMGPARTPAAWLDRSIP